MIEIGNLTLPENLSLGLPEDDLIRRGDAVNAIRKTCIMGHIPFSTKTPEGRRTIEAMAAVRHVPATETVTVAHARWIDHGSFVTCSQCGEKQYGIDTGRFYCQHCGAKMDLGD